MADENNLHLVKTELGALNTLLRASLPEILISIFVREIDFPRNSSLNFPWPVRYKYGIRSMKFFFLIKLWHNLFEALNGLENQQQIVNFDKFAAICSGQTARSKHSNSLVINIDPLS